ncbi:ABC transporter ATP-binding protein [Nocardiopsis sp. RSe5-2]|uniref:ABC transporter ATP-binding protein n=1 Tax=Nocardiopsis endophytica TaxID=3018445 RepID=A0ABT4U550_9ACTN|nr:ABC transporter ATP-binding protein [Nocardiopsis endophytica]MDA2811836.1 ABC transporter ATP-binding protein [Nocardiopsis endophytica]
MTVPLRAEGVELAHGGAPICRDVTLELARAEVTALVGPNGSGKSTLLRTLARLHRPESGRVLLEGADIASYSPRGLARNLAFLTQTPTVPSGITVAELAAYGRHPHRGLLTGRSGSKDRDAVAWALEATGTGPLRDRQIDHLSGGERQRAWIAMALAQRAPVLLLDEPTTYLDIRYQVEVLRLVRSLADDHGITVAVVLHDLNQAAAFADTMAVLAGGRIIADGRPADVLTEDVVRTAFGIDTTVISDPDTGLPTCLPYRRDGEPAPVPGAATGAGHAADH